MSKTFGKKTSFMLTRLKKKILASHECNCNHQDKGTAVY